MPGKKRKEKTVIGWSEYVDIPEWGIHGVKAKIDTGARTSALHVEDLEKLPGGRVRFHVILSRRHAHRRVEVIEKVEKWARVRSSTGEYSQRCFVKARLVLGDHEKEIEVSLVSREKMLFRMLIGRKALERDFVVDVSHRAVLGRKARKKKTGSGT